VPLDDRQVAQLGAAIDEYRFPPVYFDFVAEEEVLGSNMGTVEAAIHAMLASSSTEDVRHGFATAAGAARPTVSLARDSSFRGLSIRRALSVVRFARKRSPPTSGRSCRTLWENSFLARCCS
jgi:hypothetical protein